MQSFLGSLFRANFARKPCSRPLQTESCANAESAHMDSFLFLFLFFSFASSAYISNFCLKSSKIDLSFSCVPFICRKQIKAESAEIELKEGLFACLHASSARRPLAHGRSLQVRSQRFS